MKKKILTSCIIGFVAAIILALFINFKIFSNQSNVFIKAEIGHGPRTTYYADLKDNYVVPSGMKFKGWYRRGKKINFFTKLRTNDFVYPVLEYENVQGLQEMGFVFEIIDDDNVALVDAPSLVFTMPSKAYIDGKYYRVTTVKKGALCYSNCSIYLPDSYKIIEEDSTFGVTYLYGGRGLKKYKLWGQTLRVG